MRDWMFPREERAHLWRDSFDCLRKSQRYPHRTSRRSRSLDRRDTSAGDAHFRFLWIAHANLSTRPLASPNGFEKQEIRRDCRVVQAYRMVRRLPQHRQRLSRIRSNWYSCCFLRILRFSYQHPLQLASCCSAFNMFQDKPRCVWTRTGIRKAQP